MALCFPVGDPIVCDQLDNLLIPPIMVKPGITWLFRKVLTFWRLLHLSTVRYWTSGSAGMFKTEPCFIYITAEPCFKQAAVFKVLKYALKFQHRIGASSALTLIKLPV